MDVFQEKRRLPVRVFFTSRIEEHLRKGLDTITIYPLALQDFDACDDANSFSLGCRHNHGRLFLRLSECHLVKALE